MRNVSLIALLISGGLCPAAPALAAEPESNQAREVVEPQGSPGSAPVVPTAAGLPPAAAPTPAAPAPESLIRIYGLVNPRFIASSSAVESYSQPNEVAITAAGNPVFSNMADRARFTFQAAQSRIGFWANEQGALRAQLEFDFVDFTKATPTVASLPRLRIARADYAFAPGHLLSMGQDWDLHAPLNPHGINLVGGLFQAGNSAFMRQQLKYLYTQESLELGAAVGFPANNNSVKESMLEIGGSPTLALRGAYRLGASKVGVSVIGTQVPFALGTPDERHAASFSTVLYSELSPTPQTNVRVELNYGQNAANLGLLTLSQGYTAKDIQELGGFLSARHMLSAQHALFGMVGTQRVLNPADVAPSYSYGPLTPDAPPPAFTAANLAGTGLGMLHNTGMRLGYEFKPLSNVGLMVEGFYYHSRFRLQAVDEGRARSTGDALGLETGMLLTF